MGGVSTRHPHPTPPPPLLPLLHPLRPQLVIPPLVLQNVVGYQLGAALEDAELLLVFFVRGELLSKIDFEGLECRALDIKVVNLAALEDGLQLPILRIHKRIAPELQLGALACLLSPVDVFALAAVEEDIIILRPQPTEALPNIPAALLGFLPGSTSHIGALAHWAHSDFFILCFLS